MNFGTFLSNISDKLQGKAVGWGVAIYDGTTLKLTNSSGNAVLSPATKMTSSSRMDIMSASKTISAAAIVALLPWKSLTVDSKISPYLPAGWSKGPHVKDLTFRMLLTHTTGLKGVSGGPDTDSAAFGNLQQMIANGVPTSVPAMGAYLNEGYALTRVLLPYLWHGPADMEHFADQLGSSFPEFVAKQYEQLCKSWILASPSLQDVRTVPTGSLPYTRLYNFQNTSQSRPSGSSTDLLHSGHDHWYMSARELGRVIADLQQGTYVGGTNCWQTMTQTRASNAGSLPAYPGGDGRLGVWRFQGKNGEYFGHNGAYQFGSTASNVVGSFSGWMAFPGNVTAAFVANSNLWFGYEQEKMLMDSYDNA
jgi:CubicO group peptidase (beta-lactamase class C family)